MDYFLSSSSVDAVRWYWLVDKLHQAAEGRESFHISSDRTSIVASDSAVFYHHLRAHETPEHLDSRLPLE